MSRVECFRIDCESEEACIFPPYKLHCGRNLQFFAGGNKRLTVGGTLVSKLHSF